MSYNHLSVSVLCNDAQSSGGAGGNTNQMEDDNGPSTIVVLECAC